MRDDTKEISISYGTKVFVYFIRSNSNRIKFHYFIYYFSKPMDCAICKELYEDPVTIGCGHTFCKGCISNCIKMKEVFCPECREKSQCPNGKDSFKINIALKNLVG